MYVQLVKVCEMKIKIYIYILITQFYSISYELFYEWL